MKRYSTEEIRELIRIGNKKKFYGQRYWRYVIVPRIRKRDNNECQHCKLEGRVKTFKKDENGKRVGYKLDVNHIKPLEEYPELAYEDDNLELICVHHHNIADEKKLEIKRKKPLNEERW